MTLKFWGCDNPTSGLCRSSNVYKRVYGLGGGEATTTAALGFVEGNLDSRPLQRMEARVLEGQRGGLLSQLLPRRREAGVEVVQVHDLPNTQNTGSSRRGARSKQGDERKTEQVMGLQRNGEEEEVTAADGRGRLLSTDAAQKLMLARRDE